MDEHAPKPGFLTIKRVTLTAQRASTGIAKVRSVMFKAHLGI
jgi:hypothetical protein